MSRYTCGFAHVNTSMVRTAARIVGAAGRVVTPPRPGGTTPVRPAGPAVVLVADALVAVALGAVALVRVGPAGAAAGAGTPSSSAACSTRIASPDGRSARFAARTP